MGVLEGIEESTTPKKQKKPIKMDLGPIKKIYKITQNMDSC